MPDTPDGARRPAGLAAAIQEFTFDLERAYNARGVEGVVVPAVASLVGVLLPGTQIVSRGPWALQRSLLLALLASPPKRARDDDVEGVTEGPAVDWSLVIDPDAARDLVLHAVARRACVAIDDLRQGRIARNAWARLADATRALGELELEVVDGEPGTIELRIAEGSVCWHMTLWGEAPSAEREGPAAMADVIADVFADAGGIWLRVLDGRAEPPVVKRRQLVGDRLVRSAQDEEAACVAEEAARRTQELACARRAELEEELDAAWRELEGEGGGEADALWTPPAPSERGPSDR